MMLSKRINLGLILILGCCFSAPKTASALEDRDRQALGLAYYIMGVAEDLQGHNEEAISAYKLSVEYQENPTAYLRLGGDYARLGKLGEATMALQRVVALDPENIQARYLLAIIYSSNRDYDKAADEYEGILNSFKEAKPENVEIYGYLGQLYYAQRQYDKAIKQFEIVRSLEPKNADVLYLLGSLYLETSDQKKAMDYFLRALDIDPNHDGCLNSLGYLYAEEGQKLDEAEKLIHRALKVDPHNGAYLDSLGWVYYKKGQYKEALEALEQADGFMKDPIIYEHLGDVCYKMERFSDAKKYWSMALELAPGQEAIRKKIESLQ